MAKIWSASLAQVNGWQRWFQPGSVENLKVSVCQGFDVLPDAVAVDAARARFAQQVRSNSAL